MIRGHRVSAILLAVFTVLSGLSTAYGSNIVVDGNFEAADPGALPGTDSFNSGESIDGGSWFVTQGIVGVDTENFYVYAGDKSVYLDAGSGADSLSQVLPTVVGQTYDVGFWANADVPNTFSVTFGGTPVTDAPTSITENGFPSPSWLGNSGEFTYYSGTATATSTSTDLVFTATGFPTDDTGVTVELDDVSVSPASAVPEPSSIALVVIAVLTVTIFGAWRRRLSRSLPSA